MTASVQMVWQFKGLHGAPSKCGVSVFPRQGGGKVVLFTELADNEGTSVTNYIEHLATSIRAGGLVQPEDIVLWFEHYPESPSHAESFDVVSFEQYDGGYLRPHWRRTTRQYFESLIERAA
jgi:hypothetical protein